LEIQSDLGETVKNETNEIKSFNPCYLGNTIRSEYSGNIWAEYALFQSLLSWKYNQIHELGGSKMEGVVGFNPCYLGNTIRSDSSFSGSRASQSFNPCYLGNTIRSEYRYLVKDFSVKFQSLLSWKYNQISQAVLAGLITVGSFNPCYLGNTIRSACCWVTVNYTG